MAPYIAHIPKWFDTRKAAQVTAFFAFKSGGEINILRATKLIYLADRRSMEERDHPITGDNLVSMPFGPVNTFTYSYMNDQANSRLGEWAEFIGKRKGYDIPLARRISIDDLDELSRSDIRILERTWNEFKDIDHFDLAHWTHKYCPEWRDPNGSSIPIDFSTIFTRLGKSDPVGLSEELQAERALNSLLLGD